MFSGDCTCSGHHRQDAEKEELNELSPCLLANKTDEGKSHREKNIISALLIIIVQKKSKSNLTRKAQMSI